MATVELPPVIFGAMAHFGGGDDDARVALMRDAVDAGFRAFDTAPLYGFGASERQLGRALEGHDDVLVYSKVGLTWNDSHGDVLFQTPTHTVRRDSRPESIVTEIEQSLERLRRSHIDLVQLHHPDDHVPIGETVGALLDAHAAGKVRAIGVSNFSRAQMHAAASALGDVPLFSAQDGYNLLERSAEQEKLPTCREMGTPFLAFSPLAQGVLAGKLLNGGRLPPGDWRAGDTKFSEKNRAALCAAMEASMTPAAARHGATVSQVALAWLLAQPGVTSVIAGGRTKEHVVANILASTLELSDEELASMRREFESLQLVDGMRKRDRVKQFARRGFGKVRRLLKKR